MAAPSNKLWTVVPTAAGFLKSRFPDGNDAAVPPSWSNVPSFLQKSTAYSVDVSQYLSGSFTSITLLPVAGSLTGTGWSFGGTTLSYSGTGSGSGTARLTAINGTTQAKSNVFGYESITPPVADTFGPASVAGLSATLNASQHPVVTWKASSDPASPGANWSGLKDYQLYSNSALVTTIPTSTGLQFAMTAASVGNPTATGTVSQTGALINISGNGLDYFNTADAGQFYGAQVSGDFFAYGHIASFTSSNSLSKLMIDCRSGLNQDSPHVASVCFPLSQGIGYGLEFRGTQGASAQANTRIANTSAFWLALGRSGNVFTLYSSSAGGPWTAQSAVTVNLPTQVYVGLAAAGCGSGITASGSVDNFSVSQSADLSYTDTAATGSNIYTVTSRDLNLNTSSSASGYLINVPVVSTAPTFPRLASHLIGGSPRQYDRAAFRTYAKCMGINLINAWDGWQQGDSQSRQMNLAQVVDDIHSGSLVSTGSLVLNYYNAMTMDSVNVINKAALDSNNYWLRKPYPSGPIRVASYYTSAYSVANISDPTYAQYAADYEYDFQVAGGSLGFNTPGRTNAANPHLDGFYNDDLYFETPVDGDWAKNGGNQAAKDATQSQRMRDSRAAQFTRLVSRDASKYVVANLSQLQNVVPTTGMTGVLHGGHMEGMLGNQWSKHETGGGFDVMMAAYQRQVNITIAPNVVSFGHSNVTTDGKDFYRQTAWQGVMYGLGCCALGDAWYAMDPLGTTTPTNANSSYNVNKAGQWFEIFALDPVSWVGLTYPNVQAGLGYWGQPNEAAFPAPWMNLGSVSVPKYIYRRSFTNLTTGKITYVIVNQKGNGAVTVPLGATLLLPTDAQNPRHNGTTVTSINMTDSDCWILRQP